MGRVDAESIQQLVADYGNAIAAMCTNPDGRYADGATDKAIEARRLFKAISTALSACVAEWRPITDEQCDGRTYIVGRDMGTWGFVRGYGYFAGKPHALVSGWICRGFTDPSGDLGLGHPTHYQPLPPPPTETEGETK